jgi:hypothetical protein
MGLLAAAKTQQMRVRGAMFVDRDGNGLSRDTESTSTGGLIGNPDLEILRNRLIDLLDGATQQGAEYLFADSMIAPDGRGDSTAVSFEHALTQRWTHIPSTIWSDLKD